MATAFFEAVRGFNHSAAVPLAMTFQRSSDPIYAVADELKPLVGTRIIRDDLLAVTFTSNSHDAFDAYIQSSSSPYRIAADLIKLHAENYSHDHEAGTSRIKDWRLLAKYSERFLKDRVSHDANRALLQLHADSVDCRERSNLPPPQAPRLFPVTYDTPQVQAYAAQMETMSSFPRGPELF